VTPTITKTQTTNYEILQSKGNLFTFDEKYRKIRGNYKYKGFECFACDKHFDDGEQFGLIVTNKGNKTVCNNCAEKFREELKETGANEL
jgi:hypothetical protein